MVGPQGTRVLLRSRRVVGTSRCDVLDAKSATSLFFVQLGQFCLKIASFTRACFSAGEIVGKNNSKSPGDGRISPNFGFL